MIGSLPSPKSTKSPLNLTILANLPVILYVEGYMSSLRHFRGPPHHISIYRDTYVDVHRYRRARYKFSRTTSDQLTLFPLFPAVPTCFRTPGIFSEFLTSPTTLLLYGVGFLGALLGSRFSISLLRWSFCGIRNCHRIPQVRPST